MGSCVHLYVLLPGNTGTTASWHSPVDLLGLGESCSFSSLLCSWSDRSWEAHFLPQGSYSESCLSRFAAAADCCGALSWMNLVSPLWRGPFLLALAVSLSALTKPSGMSKEQCPLVSQWCCLREDHGMLLSALRPPDPACQRLFINSA